MSLNSILKRLTPLAFVITFLCSILITSIPFKSADAANSADWRAGRIIDDFVFTNKNALSPEMIQQFLNAKIPECDGDGSEQINYEWPADSGQYVTTSRAVYGERKGNPAPFKCLKDYYEVPKTAPGPSIPANNYGDGVPPPPGSRSAAQLIWDAAQQFNISPAVLLVTLQKEQSLITDDWPFKKQYLYAMGAYCPDSGPGGSANCDSNYAGFSLQMREGAQLFRWYLDNMNQPWWDYAKPGWRDILYNVSVRKDTCGYRRTYIETAATAALYTYTPYTPNQAALNNLYGSVPGNSNDPNNLDAYCAAYGNRNFWRMFTDWFGSPNAINGTITLSKGLETSKTSSIYAYDTITASYEVQNSASYDVYVGGLGVCGRLNGANYDFGFNHQVTIPANGKVTISYSRWIDAPGDLYLFVCSYHPNMGYASDVYPYDATGSTPRRFRTNVISNPLITTGLNFSPASPAIGQEVTATATITNASNNPVNIGSLVVAGRNAQGSNVDFGIVNDVVVPAGGSYSYSQKRTFGTPGNHSFFIANWNGVWRTDYPKSSDGSVARQTNLNILDSPLIISGIILDDATPAVGQTVTASLVIRNTTTSPINVGSMVIAGRDSQGRNVDFGIVNDVIVPAGGTVPYSSSRTFSATGAHTFFIANWNGLWRTDYPKSLDSSVVRQLTLIIN